MLAAIISTMDSQILVLATSLVEDLYRKVFYKSASSKHLVKASRLAIVLIALSSFALASFKFDTILNIVYLAWAGLGASFGPITLIALFSKKPSAKGALASLITGCLVCLVCQVFSIYTQQMLIPAFTLSFLAYFITSLVEKSARRVT